MNFTKPQDFQYVQGANIDAQHPYGDLNRIDIDNAIMPVRNTGDKRKLRGIDSAFLMEAVEERRRCVLSSDNSFTFSRCLNLQQLQNIYAKFKEAVPTTTGLTDETPLRLAKGFPNFETGVVYEYPTFQDLLAAVSANILERTDIAETPTDDDILQVGVQNAFDFIDNAKYFAHRIMVGYSEWSKSQYELLTERYPISFTSSDYFWYCGTVLDSEYSQSLAEMRVGSGGFQQEWHGERIDINADAKSDFAKGCKFIVCGYADKHDNPNPVVGHNFAYVVDAFNDSIDQQPRTLHGMIDALKSRYSLTSFNSDENYSKYSYINVSYIFPFVDIRDRTKWNV